MAIRRQERAKQFAPFEALNGLRQALAAAEREQDKTERSELSDEMKNEIEQELSKVRSGTKVNAVFFSDGYYCTVEGPVTKLDTIYRYIIIGSGKIHFDDLYGLKVI